MSTFISSIAPAVLPNCDFSPTRQIANVGGSRQSILIDEILRMHPTLKGILFNRSFVSEKNSPPIAKWLDLTLLSMTSDCNVRSR